MRIRSIKPEFWRSSDISCLAIEDRFLFIGLWSYVDDNGVGEDRVSMIAADLFADDIERDPTETFARVSRGLARLAEGGQIVRYTVAGRDYFEILSWKQHQRIDKPGKPRLPHHDADGSTIREASRHSRDTLAPGTGIRDQGSGNKGTGNEGAGEAENADAPPTPKCKKHSGWTHNEDCRVCGADRRAFEEWQCAEAAKPRPVKPHEHRWLADGTCIGCEERRDAA